MKIIKQSTRGEAGWKVPAIGRCECGNEVHLSGGTNSCDRCRRDYNQFGQQLSARQNWGEETGEHWTECV